MPGDSVGGDVGSAAPRSPATSIERSVLGDSSGGPPPRASIERPVLGAGEGGGEEEHFQGASGAARDATPVLHECSHCDFECANFSMFANVYKREGFPFARLTDPAVQRAIGQAEQHEVAVSQFDKTAVQTVCIHCCSEYHERALKKANKSYFKEESGEPSS